MNKYLWAWYGATKGIWIKTKYTVDIDEPDIDETTHLGRYSVEEPLTPQLGREFASREEAEIIKNEVEKFNRKMFPEDFK